jgi:enoyl-CoA hydratase/3-hydroxyacyl-CoA dehydrogenase
MSQENEKNTEFLIPEPIPLLKERKGGGLNLIHVALLLEAARMIDEGMDIPSVEAAAKKAFGVSKGFLSAMDEAGIVEACSVMETLADDSDPEDPFFKFYHNFFSPPESCKDKIREMERAEDKETVRWISEEEAQQEAKDSGRVDALVRRFHAVAFITSIEVVESEVLDLHDVDRLCKETLGWKEGPFVMMNRIGIGAAMEIVTEKMYLSHRREINFPVPRLMIQQAKKEEPWPLNSKT